jgi:hypothetical protein
MIEFAGYNGTDVETATGYVGNNRLSSYDNDYYQYIKNYE